MQASTPPEPTRPDPGIPERNDDFRWLDAPDRWIRLGNRPIPRNLLELVAEYDQ